MEFLQFRLGDVPVIDYLGILCVAVLVTFVVMLVRRIVLRRLTGLALKSETLLDDFALRLIQRISPLLVFLTALALGLRAPPIPEALVQPLRLVIIGALFIQAGLWGEAVIRLVVTRSVALADAGSTGSSPAQRAVFFVGRWMLWSLILVLLLENAGLDLSALIAGLGIGGIAIALAVQNILGDLFCYAAIILDRPFEIGDFLVVGDQRGTVEKIGIRTTRVRSLDGEQLVFSNNDLVSSRVRNFKRMQERRILFQIGVTYETGPEKLRRIPGFIRDIIEEIPETRFDRAHFAGFGDFSLNFEIVYFVLNSDYNRFMDIQQAINLALCERFDDEGIEFAYPTQTMYLRGEARMAAIEVNARQGG